MSDIQWHTETRKVKELKPHKSNPRRMTTQQAEDLEISLEKFNYVEPVVIQPDNRIVAGHMRINILKKLNRKDEVIEVRVPNRMLTDEEMKEYMIRSNKNTGEWDWDCLADMWDPLDLHKWGFSYDELVGETKIIEEPDNKDDKSVEEKEKCELCGNVIRKSKRDSNGKKTNRKTNRETS